jgi:hypothetical protein
MCEKFLHPKIGQANMKKLLIALTFLPGCVPEVRMWAVGPWVAVRQLANRGRVHGLGEARPNVS